MVAVPLFHFDIFSRFLAFIGNYLVFDILAFIKRGEARPLYGADMHEHILATVRWLHKSVSLGRVEPFYCTACHNHSLSCYSRPDSIASRDKPIRQRICGDLGVSARAIVCSSDDVGHLGDVDLLASSVYEKRVRASGRWQ